MPASFWLSIHVLWVLWMTAGIILALLGFAYPSLWRMPIFRTTHLVGLLLTATVPLWNDGVCPITLWETGPESDPFLNRLLRAVIYWDAPQYILSITTALAALATMLIYVFHPPWRPRPLGRIPGRKS